jgi:hypothetical protein
MTMRFALIATGLSMAIAFTATEARAQEVTPEESQNPLTKLRGLTFQNNFDFGSGEENRTGYQLLLQPWQTDIGKGTLRLRSLAGLPLLYLPDPSRPEGGTFGLGDAEVSHFWSPRLTGTSAVGVGPILRIPVATDTHLGTGKWSAGVTVAAIARPRRWLVGFRTYNLWSFAGDEDRPDVNQFYFQYFVLRTLDNGWYLISTPALTANWDAPSGNRWVVPLGGGAGKLLHFGRRALDAHTAVYYYVVRPETLPSARWQLRVQLQYLFAK